MKSGQGPSAAGENWEEPNKKASCALAQALCRDPAIGVSY